jgi:hypothetical protein
MGFRAAWILLPVALMAQTQTPPPEVDEALRARVNQFFTYHTQGTSGFRKAYELVAEDTKDYYFAAQKHTYKSFKVDSVQYKDNFTKASVSLTCQESMRMSPQMPETVVPVPMTTEWKIENGKWVWYYIADDAQMTPMGRSDLDAVKKHQNDTQLPNVSPQEMAKQAQSIMKRSGVDKTEIVLPLDKISSDQVVFHNKQGGSIRLGYDAGAKPAGMTVTLDKTDLRDGEDAILKIAYEPSTGAVPQPFTVRVFMQPFNQTFPITVRFAAKAP